GTMLAERVGFEPTNTREGITGIPVQRLRPLGHLSGRILAASCPRRGHRPAPLAGRAILPYGTLSGAAAAAAGGCAAVGPHRQRRTRPWPRHPAQPDQAGPPRRAAAAAR